MAPLPKTKLETHEAVETQLALMDSQEGTAAAVVGGRSVAIDQAAGAAADSKQAVVSSVPYWRLYSQADRLDKFLVTAGTVAAMANGVAWPVFSILFASFANSFGTAGGDPDFASSFASIALQFVYLAIATFVANYIQAAAWMWTGHRQASRLRLMYLRAVLRQDVAYFDVQGAAGSLLQGLNDDSAAVQAAMSDKTGIFIQNATTFIAGIAVAFWRGWDMTLVMVGAMPFLAGVGFVFTKLTTDISTKSADAYSKASSIAQQSISQVRTVAAYNREQKSVDDYTEALELPLQVGLRQAVVSGLSLGGINAIIYFTYALAFYYGAWRVSVGAYDGGDVLNVLVASFLGGFALGQAGPILQVFSRGQAAAASIFAAIERVPLIETDDSAGRKLEHVEGRLELRNIAFSYPTRLDAPVFTDQRTGSYKLCCTSDCHLCASEDDGAFDEFMHSPTHVPTHMPTHALGWTNLGARSVFDG